MREDNPALVRLGYPEGAPEAFEVDFVDAGLVAHDGEGDFLALGRLEPYFLEGFNNAADLEDKRVDAVIAADIGGGGDDGQRTVRRNGLGHDAQAGNADKNRLLVSLAADDGGQAALARKLYVVPGVRPVIAAKKAPVAVLACGGVAAL